MPAILNYDGRFKLWDRPAVYPQVDLVNGAPEGPVFDLDVNREDGGAQYLRVDHVEEMARALGWKSPEEVSSIVEENDKLKNQINNLPNAIEELKDGIDRRIAEFYGNLDYRPDLPVGLAEANESDDESSDGDSSGTGKDPLESFGLGSLGGPDDIPSNSGNGTGKKLSTAKP